MILCHASASSSAVGHCMSDIYRSKAHVDWLKNGVLGSPSGQSSGLSGGPGTEIPDLHSASFIPLTVQKHF
jgi:hypothetical protein